MYLHQFFFFSLFFFYSLSYHINTLHHPLCFVSHCFIFFNSCTTQTLNFIVPPELEPFSFGNPSSPYHSSSATAASHGDQPYLAQSAGTRTRVLCGLSRGDTPVKFTWLKDGRRLPSSSSSSSLSSTSPSAKIKIAPVDDFASLLTIARLEPAHSGKYTCVAENLAGRAQHSANLNVKGDLTH